MSIHERLARHTTLQPYTERSLLHVCSSYQGKSRPRSFVMVSWHLLFLMNLFIYADSPILGHFQPYQPIVLSRCAKDVMGFVFHVIPSNARSGVLKSNMRDQKEVFGCLLQMMLGFAVLTLNLRIRSRVRLDRRKKINLVGNAAPSIFSIPNKTHVHQS